ncbi:MAG: hypothetical protein IKY91_00160 [Akkermansia sp.]|nr:hypothetical protein [Akkermansia sp.]
MRTPRTAVKRRPHRRLSHPEFGDWRVAVDNPSDAEHLQVPRPSVFRRLKVQAQYWQSADTGYSCGVYGAKRVFRRVAGLLVLLPLSVVMVFALMVQLHNAAPVVGNIDFWQSIPVWYSVLGALVFITLKYFRLVEAFLMYSYVLGHELTHALAAIMCFGKVETVSVDLDGGYVDTDTDNIFVSLAPYFVPLWMLVWMAVLFVANWIYPFEAYLPWFYAGFGFWWSFHVYWTLWVIPREQPDLLENEVIFSFMIIMLANIVTLLLVLRCFGVISLRGYLADFKACAVEIYTSYSELLVWLWQLI